MGWLSGICNLLGSVVSGAQSLFGSDIIENIIGKVVDWIFGTTELKSAPKYDERSATMDETLKINELLEKQRNNFSKVITDLEQVIKNDTLGILDDMTLVIKKINSNYNCGINIKFIEKQFKNFMESLNNCISEKVNKRIQISDTECSNLLKLVGENREQEIDKYIKKIINEGIDTFSNEFQEKISEILTLVEDAINEKLSLKNEEAVFLLNEINEAKKNIGNNDLKKIEFVKKEKEIEKCLLILEN